MTIRVLAIDDSAVVRSVLTRILSRDPEIEVVGTAPDPFVGRDKIVQLQPDVVLLDLEMPRMDGITFLRKLMSAKPMPVLVVSSLTRDNSKIMLEALSAGAVDVVSKPRGAHTLEEVGVELIEKIKSARHARVQRRAASTSVQQPAKLAHFDASHQVVAIGASTGGTRALEDVLMGLPAGAPATVVVQHMPEEFTRSFAQRLDELGAMRVKEGEHGDILAPGTMVIAPGNQHMELVRSGALFKVRLHDAAPVRRHRPSVDVLFQSVAVAAGRNALGVLLTGMGDDGARGLLAMRKAGAKTVAQDEASSVVYGMPKAAVDIGAADKQLALGQVAPAIMNWATSARAKVG
ncbi:MAG: chemotaxis response regulator protein-glutamate methylesterase [Myxococcales bacterium]|nr:chemotaxis response regulator protein-glutamate methylesterase [Myxococcales bacterium]